MNSIELNWWFLLFLVASILFVRFPRKGALRRVQKTLWKWLAALVIQISRILLRVILVIGWCIFLDQYERKFLQCLFRCQDGVLQAVLSSILSGEDLSEEQQRRLEEKSKALKKSYRAMLKYGKVKLEA